MVRKILAIIGIACLASGHAQEPAPEKALRPTWPGLKLDGRVLLPNGWSLKPAGRQLKLGDLPVQITQHPTEPILAILHAGYGDHEVVTVDQKTSRIIGRVNVPYSFSGLIFSEDGKQL
jgi:hypothetical protein